MRVYVIDVRRWPSKNRSRKVFPVDMRHDDGHNYINSTGGGTKPMKKPRKSEAPKRKALREQGALNRHPEKVTDPLFDEGEFFDRQDLVQVKYEMLRRVEAEGKTVTETAGSFGFSRPCFYQAQAAFAGQGLPGLVPKKRGPRGAHKATEEVVAFLAEVLEKEGRVSSHVLARRVRDRFGLKLHRRTIERALARKKKLR
jgi:transposase